MATTKKWSIFQRIILVFLCLLFVLPLEGFSWFGKKDTDQKRLSDGCWGKFSRVEMFPGWDYTTISYFNFTSKGEFTYITYDYTLSPTSEIHIGKYTLNTDDADNKQMLLQFEPDVNGEKWEDLTHNYRIRSDNCLVLNETEVFKHFDDYDSFLDEADAFLSK